MRILTPISLLLAALVCAASLEFFGEPTIHAQDSTTGMIRVGERLTYNISYNKFQNIAYAETSVLSTGKIGGKEAIEVHSKFRTLKFLSTASLFMDIDRTSFISAIDGSTLVVKNTDVSNGVPIDSSVNFIEKSPGAFDLTAILFRIRSSGGAGSYSMFENDKLYTVTFQTVGTETVKSDAGEFPANVIDVKSDFLSENGFTGLKISLLSDGTNIPVRFRLSRDKNNEYVGLIASIQIAAELTPTPSVVAVQTPRPTPAPSVKPPVYIDNQPLNGLPFELGESLEYAVTIGKRSIGTMILTANERKLVNDHDSLLLTSTLSNVAGTEVFGDGSKIRTNVDPDTLSPFDYTVAFNGPLGAYNQGARFDQEKSRVILQNNAAIDVPVGTHNILSLFYALRLFNLNPSKDTGNHVNDTRVSVFWQGRPNIFILRPSEPQPILVGDQKILAQQITVSTGNPQLDALQIKVWLSSDERRLPLKMILGGYQFDLKLRSLTPGT